MASTGPRAGVQGAAKNQLPVRKAQAPQAPQAIQATKTALPNTQPRVVSFPALPQKVLNFIVGGAANIEIVDSIPFQTAEGHQNHAAQAEAVEKLLSAPHMQNGVILVSAHKDLETALTKLKIPIARHIIPAKSDTFKAKWILAGYCPQKEIALQNWLDNVDRWNAVHWRNGAPLDGRIPVNPDANQIKNEVHRLVKKP